MSTYLKKINTKEPDMNIQPVREPDMNIQPVPGSNSNSYLAKRTTGGDDSLTPNTSKQPTKVIGDNPDVPPDATIPTNPANPAPAPGGSDPTLNYLINLPGLSDSTKKALGDLINNGYQPSKNVTDALGELNKVIANQPAAFQSQYFDQLNNIMNQILGREAFSYDLTSDPMYQQYREQYISGGKRAMQDTMGQAAAMTGGYGSSYASTAGNQAYQQYLTQLNDKAPELYNMALQGYQLTGDQLQNQYNMLNDAYQSEYGQWQDAYSRWQDERNYLNDKLNNERNFDYNDYQNRLNYWRDLASMENDQYNRDRDFANADRDYYYNYAMQMIQAGKMPSQDLLDRLGLSSDDIRKLRKYYKNQNKDSSSSGGGSGSKKGSKSSSDPSSAAPTADSGIPEGMTPEEYADYLVWLKRMDRGGYNGNVPTTR